MPLESLLSPVIYYMVLWPFYACSFTSCHCQQRTATTTLPAMKALQRVASSLSKSGYLRIHFDLSIHVQSLIIVIVIVTPIVWTHGSTPILPSAARLSLSPRAGLTTPALSSSPDRHINNNGIHPFGIAELAQIAILCQTSRSHNRRSTGMSPPLSLLQQAWCRI